MNVPVDRFTKLFKILFLINVSVYLIWLIVCERFEPNLSHLVSLRGTYPAALRFSGLIPLRCATWDLSRCAALRGTYPAALPFAGLIPLRSATWDLSRCAPLRGTYPVPLRHVGLYKKSRYKILKTIVAVILFATYNM